MNGSLDPQVMSAEGERMEQVLRQLEGFVPTPDSPAPKLPRLSALYKLEASLPKSEADVTEPAS